MLNRESLSDASFPSVFHLYFVWNLGFQSVVVCASDIATFIMDRTIFHTIWISMNGTTDLNESEK